MYNVYVLENATDKGLYIGHTNNLKRRLREHRTGSGGRTTSLKRAWRLIYFEAYVNKSDAFGREKFLKSGSGRKYIKKQLAHYFGLRG
ncbi:GIY-YIG nuclease family protein [Candidatus Parcubacteria bacterium]|nr:GIY-YIG nuclease family protein [Candidatus Parcubacteria bacterium]